MTPPKRSDPDRRVRELDQQNRRAARIILDDQTGRYQGLMTEWAKRTLAKKPIQERDHDTMAL